MRKYIADNNIGSDEKIFKMTKQGAWQLLRRKLKKLGVADYWQYSLHNIRKTHGMWLKTLQHRGTDLDVSEICMRLGHDMNTFLKHYGSPSIFGDADRDRMIDILGDIYGLK
jgi:integrase